MPTKMNLGEDEVFVSGRSSEKALKLLTEADKQGIDQRMVRTTMTGYIVPKSLVNGDEKADVEDHADTSVTAEPEKEEEVAQEAPATSGQFDPAEHKLDEVKAYLEDADEEERQRVLTAEKSGKARKSLLPDDEGNED